MFCYFQTKLVAILIINILRPDGFFSLHCIKQRKEAKTWNFTKSNIPPWVFFTFFELCKWYQIAESITNILRVSPIKRLAMVKFEEQVKYSSILCIRTIPFLVINHHSLLLFKPRLLFLFDN